MKINATLSRRESEIAELLAWGASKKEVADKLFISTRTVENTARNIYTKTGIQKATELCVWWFCTKCDVPVSKDPLKHAFIAVVLLFTLLPRELCGFGDPFRIGRAKVRITSTRTGRGRRNEDGSKIFNFLER